MREMTERTEVLGELVKLVGTDSDCIVRETSNILDHTLNFQDSLKYKSCYGDGDDSVRIVEALK